MSAPAAQPGSAPGSDAAPHAALAAAPTHEELLALEAATSVAPVVPRHHAGQALECSRDSQHSLSVYQAHSLVSPLPRSLRPRGPSRGASRRGLSYPRTPTPAFRSLVQARHLPRMAGGTPGDVPRLTPERRVAPRLRPGPFCIRCCQECHAAQCLFLRAASRSKCFQQY